MHEPRALNSSVNTTTLQGGIRMANDANLETLLLNETEIPGIHPFAPTVLPSVLPGPNPHEEFTLSLMTSKEWGQNTSVCDLSMDD
jgi:hypothetical protein